MCRLTYSPCNIAGIAVRMGTSVSVARKALGKFRQWQVPQFGRNGQPYCLSPELIDRVVVAYKLNGISSVETMAIGMSMRTTQGGHAGRSEVIVQTAVHHSIIQQIEEPERTDMPDQQSTLGPNVRSLLDPDGVVLPILKKVALARGISETAALKHIVTDWFAIKLSNAELEALRR